MSGETERRAGADLLGVAFKRFLDKVKAEENIIDGLGKLNAETLGTDGFEKREIARVRVICWREAAILCHFLADRSPLPVMSPDSPPRVLELNDLRYRCEENLRRLRAKYPQDEELVVLLFDLTQALGGERQMTVLERTERVATWPCTRCSSRGLCAADCPFGPWNYAAGSGAAHPKTTRLGYMIRQRRWVRGPVPREEIFFREGDRYPASSFHRRPCP